MVWVLVLEQFFNEVVQVGINWNEIHIRHRVRHGHNRVIVTNIIKDLVFSCLLRLANALFQLSLNLRIVITIVAIDYIVSFVP